MPISCVTSASSHSFAQEPGEEEAEACGGEEEEEETEEERAFHLCLIGGGRAGEPVDRPSRGRRRNRKGASSSGGGAGSRAGRKKPTSAPTCPSPSISEPSTPPNTPAPPNQPVLDLPTPLPADFRRDVLPSDKALQEILEYMSEVKVSLLVEDQVRQNKIQSKNFNLPLCWKRGTRSLHSAVDTMILAQYRNVSINRSNNSRPTGRPQPPTVSSDCRLSSRSPAAVRPPEAPLTASLVKPVAPRRPWAICSCRR